VAVQVTLLAPSLLVSGVAQLWVATPDVASAALALAVALPLSATGLGDTLGAKLGAVVSRLSVTDCALVPPRLVAVQVNVVPAMSLVMLVAPQPLVFEMVDSASLTVQETPTSLVYQP
jgi:hypothetical protein